MKKEELKANRQKAAALRKQGLRYKQIAHELGVSIPTISNYLRHMGLAGNGRNSSANNLPTAYFSHTNKLERLLELAPGMERVELSLPVVSDEFLELLTEAVVVIASRVSDAKSRKRYEFLNNHAMRVTEELRDRKLDWTKYYKDSQAYSVVLTPDVDQRGVFRKCVDLTYKEKSIPEDHRYTFDFIMSLWFSAMLARDGIVTFCDETTGESVLFPRCDADNPKS